MLDKQQILVLDDVVTELYIMLNERFLSSSAIIREPEPTYDYAHPHMMGEPGFSQDELSGFHMVVQESIVQVWIENGSVEIWMDNRQLGAWPWEDQDVWDDLRSVAQQIAQRAQEPTRQASHQRTAAFAANEGMLKMFFDDLGSDLFGVIDNNTAGVAIMEAADLLGGVVTEDGPFLYIDLPDPTRSHTLVYDDEYNTWDIWPMDFWNQEIALRRDDE